MASAYFGEQLAAPAGNRARQQLAERGISAQTIEQLGLGFAPQSREGLKARLLKQGFSQALVIQSGLVVQRDGGPSTGSGPSRAGSRDRDSGSLNFADWRLIEGLRSWGLEGLRS